MKKLLIAAAIAATTFAPHAFAQAKNFEGFSVLGGLNVASSKLDFEATPGSTSTSSDKTATNLVLQAEYGIALSNSFVLGLGVSAGLGDLSFGEPRNSTGEVKLKDHVSAYVAPGFALSDSALIYGKLASISATAGASTSTSISGMGYGLGARFLAGKNVFYQVEYLYNKYDDKGSSTGTTKLQSGALSFGVGYKF
jgi:outer membrane immunogenic protein